jgi:hypothetical protein
MPHAACAAKSGRHRIQRETASAFQWIDREENSGDRAALTSADAG